MKLNKYQELERLILYITDAFNVTGNEETRIEMTENSKRIEFRIETRLVSYDNMSHSKATQDLSSSLEFFKNHLPEEMVGVADKIYGSVEDKGYITITVKKYLG